MTNNPLMDFLGFIMSNKCSKSQVVIVSRLCKAWKQILTSLFSRQEALVACASPFLPQSMNLKSAACECHLICILRYYLLTFEVCCGVV